MADKPVAKPPAKSSATSQAKPTSPAKPTGPSTPAKPARPPGTESPARASGVATPADPPKPVHIGGESLLDRIRPHAKTLAYITGAAAVLLLVLSAIAEIRERMQEGDTEAVDRVLVIARQPIRGKDEKPDPAQPSFADRKERAAAALSALTKEDTDAAGRAFRGGLLLDAGRIDEAIAEYRAGTIGKSLDAVLCREGLGLALEAKAAAEKESAARQKGFEEALAAFVTMQPDEAGQRRAHALYHQARLQLLLGKRDEAKALFEKAREVNNKADFEIETQITRRLAALGAS